MGPPPQGLPSEVIGSYSGSGLPPGTNETWLTLYSPLGLQAATVNGQSQGVSDGAELGVHAYSEYVDIPPESSVTLTFDLAGAITPGPGYKISLYNQPMVLADQDTVSVEPTTGWTVTGPAAWFPGDDVTEGHTFLFRGDLLRPNSCSAHRPQPIHLGHLADFRVSLSAGAAIRRGPDEAQGGWFVGRVFDVGRDGVAGRRPARLGAGGRRDVPLRARTQPTTVTPTTAVSTTPTVVTRSPPLPVRHPPLRQPPGPSSTAFTGAELALMFTIGAIALGVGGMLVLVTRRRRSEPAYETARR